MDSSNSAWRRRIGAAASGGSMTFGSKALMTAGTIVMAAGAVLMAQNGDAAKVVADMRQALGGDKLAKVSTLTATGKNQRANGETSISGDYEMALALPDRFVTTQVLASTPMGNVALTSGFNGDGLVQENVMPQQPGGGGMRMFVSNGAGPNASPEQQQAANARQLISNKQEFARMALGVFGSSMPAYPVEFSYAGVAEAPDGKADILDVKGRDDFAGKLFVDQKTHLPLMFSWMAKEPLRLVNTGGPAGGRAGGGAQTMTFSQSGRSGGGSSQEDRDRMMKEMDERMKAAEANRKIVEYRVYYGDYRKVDGVMLPHSFQQSIAGDASSEIAVEKYKINPKIDEHKFDIKK
jgi:hypothetical protein